MSELSHPKSSEPHDLIDEIELAFSGIQLDGGVSMAQAIADEQSLFPPRTHIDPPKSSTTSWKNIDPKMIERFNYILPWLDAKGFRFYIPAFMLWTLRNQDSDQLVEDNTVAALAPVKRTLNGHKVDSQKASMHALLSPDQRKAIRRFLEHEAKHEEYAAEAQLALDHYW